MAGDPFEPELAAAAAGMPEAAVMDGDRRAAAARSPPHDRRAAPLPLPASARSPRGLRGHRGRLAAGRPRALRRRRSRRAAPRRRRAPTTSSARRARATPAPSPSCARPARRPSGWPRRAPRTGSARRSACSPAAAPAEERIELLLARARALTAAGRFDDSHSTLLEALAIVPGDSHRAARPRRARLCRRRGQPRPAGAGARPPDARPRRAPRPGLAGGGGADDRARPSTRSGGRGTTRCTSGPSARSTRRGGSATRG